MTKELFIEAIIKLFSGVILVCLILFLSAGNFFANGLLLVGVLFVPMLCAGIIMMIKNPDLLEKRLKTKEKLRKQDIIVKLCGAMFLAGFITAGLNFRFGWYVLPKSVTIFGVVTFLLSYIIYGEVLRENRYLSRTIEVTENQKVIDKGLYGIVRHPMYASTIFLFLSMPLILGSIYAFFVFLAYPFLIAERIKTEEEFLEKELEGYLRYKEKVKYRLLPFVW